MVKAIKNWLGNRELSNRLRVSADNVLGEHNIPISDRHRSSLLDIWKRNDEHSLDLLNKVGIEGVNKTINESALTLSQELIQAQAALEKINFLADSSEAVLSVRDMWSSENDITFNEAADLYMIMMASAGN